MLIPEAEIGFVIVLVVLNLLLDDLLSFTKALLILAILCLLGSFCEQTLFGRSPTPWREMGEAILVSVFLMLPLIWRESKKAYPNA
jgi:hypothetical protein